jgi:hypothetical protein
VATLPDGAGGTVEAPSFMTWADDGLVLATLSGRIPGADVASNSPTALLRLFRRGDRLTGFAAAYASPSGLRHLYPFTVQLRRLR